MRAPHDEIVGPGTLRTLEAHDLGQSDYQVVFLQFKKAQLAVDLEWLETLERLWPSACPPQDHVEIVCRFAQEFMAWRDGVIAPNDRPPSTAEDTRTLISRPFPRQHLTI
jgi:hypothetical protein